MSSAAAEAKLKKAIEKSYLIAKETCTFPAILNLARPLTGSLTLQGVLMILGGAMGIVSILIALYLLYGHLRYFTRAEEQRHLIRIVFFIPVIVITSFLSITFPSQSGWIAPIGDYYESFAISAIFLFYCRIIVNHDSPQNEVTFPNVKHTIAAADSQSDPKKSQSYGWLRRAWFLVLQIAVTRIITFVANEVLFGVTCPLDTSRSNGALAITVIQSVTSGFAVTGVISFERRTRKLLVGVRPTFKLISFKAIIILQAIQEIIFTALLATKVLFPSPPFYVSYNDYKTGIPYIIILFEMFIVSFMFLWSYHFEQYQKEFQSGVPRAEAPPLAFMSLFFPLDIFKAAISGFKSA